MTEELPPLAARVKHFSDCFFIAQSRGRRFVVSKQEIMELVTAVAELETRIAKGEVHDSQHTAKPKGEGENITKGSGESHSTSVPDADGEGRTIDEQRGTRSGHKTVGKGSGTATSGIRV